jgi:hypothetical protein
MTLNCLAPRGSGPGPFSLAITNNFVNHIFFIKNVTKNRLEILIFTACRLVLCQWWGV